MTSEGVAPGGHIPGFEAPLHRALTGTILLGGAPRGIAILNGTLSAALGLGLQQWIAGLAIWLIGHSLAVFAAKRDPDFASVLLRHLRQKAWLSC
jgi:type IV secretion system protein VirB3